MNKESEHLLTIVYRFLDGNVAAPTYYGYHEHMSQYNVVSPVIEGYKTHNVIVSGTMPNCNVSFGLIYTNDKNNGAV